MAVKYSLFFSQKSNKDLKRPRKEREKGAAGLDEISVTRLVDYC